MRRLFLLSSLMLCGCMSQFLAGPDGPDRVEGWLAQERYAEAIEYLEELDPAHPDYANLRAGLPSIRRAAAELESRTLREGRELTRAKRWHDALVLYEDALEKLPNSERLAGARESCIAARDSHVRRLRTEVLLERGKWLSRDTHFKQRIAIAVPRDRSAQRALRKSVRDVEATSDALHACGQEALDRAEYAMARQCLSRAYELTPKPTIHNALAVAVIKTMRPPSVQEDVDKRRERRIAKLTKAYEQAYAEGDLPGARRHIDDLAALDRDSKALKRMQRELESAISMRLEVGIEAGRKLYSRGRIQPALDTWNELLVLAPDNEELSANIARAERVLMNLDRLKAKVRDEPPPAP